MSKTPSEVIFTAAGGVLRPKSDPGPIIEEASRCVSLERQNAAMREALALIYGKWENGETCYEFPDTSRERRIGNALDLTHEERAAIRELLK